MIAICKRAAVFAFAMSAMFAFVDTASAVCFGCGTTAYYPSTYAANYGGAYNAYYPATYQTNYAGTGWYPGYYWDRVRTRLFGSPTTYVAAYPTTAYYAGHAPNFSASYAPAYATAYAAPAGCSSCSTCQSCTAGYSGCSSCGVQQVTMRPVCTTACSSPCSSCTSGCSASSAQVVTQASYEQPACGCNSGSSHVHSQQAPPESQPTPEVAPPDTFDITNATGDAQRPAVPQDTSAIERREENKPPTNGAEAQPGPGDETPDTTATPEGEFYKKLETGDSGAMLEPLKLHDPNDRTAWRSIAPVKTALYKQPVAHRNVSMQRVTAEQARQDAIGWKSVAK